MLQLSQLSLNFGAQQLFENLSLSIRPGRCIGLVGSNGSGKTTLLNIIEGTQEFSSGEIYKPPHLSIGYLKQEPEIFGTKNTLLEEVLSVQEDILNLEEEMRDLEHSISESSDPALIKRYGQLQDDFHHKGGYTLESKAKEIVAGLGFKESDHHRLIKEFSGGWNMRISLAKLLLKNPALMLLDEPTNHLDLETLLWLENFLSSYTGTILMVSHDRYFMDKLVTEVAEIFNRRINTYKGNYSFYETKRLQDLETLKTQKKSQDKQIKKTEEFIERFRYKSTKAKQVQSRVKQLDKLDRIEIDDSTKNIRLLFPEGRRSGDPVISMTNVAFSYNVETIFSQVNLDIRRNDQLALFGVNGSGKTTLLKLIHGELQANSGTLKIGHNVDIAYFAQYQLGLLNPKHTILEEIAPLAPDYPISKVRALIGNFLFSGDDIDKKISVLSGGEKSRIVLIKMLLRKANFLILDEPTNHLDIKSKEVLAGALKDFKGTILLVSHDRAFLDLLVNKIFYFKDNTIKEYLGNYSEFHAFLEQDSLLALSQNDQSATQNKISLKEQKRIEAELRQEKSKKLKPYTQKLAKLEKNIEIQTARAEELVVLMNSDAFSQYSPRDMTKTFSDYESCKNILADLEMEWLDISEKIELLKME